MWILEKVGTLQGMPIATNDIFGNEQKAKEHLQSELQKISAEGYKVEISENVIDVSGNDTMYSIMLLNKTDKLLSYRGCESRYFRFRKNFIAEIMDDHEQMCKRVYLYDRDEPDDKVLVLEENIDTPDHVLITRAAPMIEDVMIE